MSPAPSNSDGAELRARLSARETDALHLAETTVKTHVQNILARRGTSTPARE